MVDFCAVTWNSRDMEFDARPGDVYEFTLTTRALVPGVTHVYVPEVVSATTDANGDGAIDLVPGEYSVSVGSWRGRVVIPNEASASLGACFDQDPPTAPALSDFQALAADAEAAAASAADDAAATAADRAAIEAQAASYVTLTGTQTLTNKTLTAPVLTGPILSGTARANGLTDAGRLVFVGDLGVTPDYDDLATFQTTTVPAPIGSIIVEGHTLVSDAAGNIASAGGRTWKQAGEDLNLTMCGTDSDLSNDFAGILQQAINDVSGGLYDRLVLDPKRDGTPYSDEISTAVVIPEGYSLTMHFDSRALIKPRTNFQHVVLDGTNGPFLTNLLVADADALGILSVGVFLADGSTTASLTNNTDFTIGTSGAFYTITFTPGSGALPVSPVLGSIMAVSGRRAALSITGIADSGQNFTGTGYLNIDISEQGYIQARSTGGGFSSGGSDYVSLDMIIEVTSGADAGYGAANLSKRGDTAYYPGQSKSTYVREVRAFGMNDLAVYASGGGTVGGTDDGKGLQIDRIYAERCANGFKVGREQRGAYLQRVELIDGYLGILGGETGGMDQGGGLHINSLRAVRMGSGAVDLQFFIPTLDRLGAGVRIDSISLEDWGYRTDGVTPITGQAGVRLAGSSGVSIGNYNACYKAWTPHADAPAILMTSGTSSGNIIESGYIQDAAVGYRETGSSSNRVGNKIALTMKDVTTPLDIPSNSVLQYDLNIVTESAGPVITSTRMVNTAFQTVTTDDTPALSLGKFLRQGDKGLGDIAILDDASGSYDDFLGDTKFIGNLSSGSVPANAPATGGFTGLQVHASASRAIQLLMRAQSTAFIPTMYLRNHDAGVWTAWERMLSVGMILGTVSQSGGVPTGSIIERGSNANGEYVKFADGTMIATHQFAGAEVTTALGSVFHSVTTNWTYPVAFATGTTPVMSVSLLSIPAGRWAISRSTGNTLGQVRQYNAVSSATLIDYQVMAVGRWF